MVAIPSAFLPADNIHAVNLRYFVGPVDVPDTNYYAGYTMVQLNSTRVCETYVSDECVIKKGADVCVMEQVGRSVMALMGDLAYCIAVCCHVYYLVPGQSQLFCRGRWYL